MLSSALPVRISSSELFMRMMYWTLALLRKTGYKLWNLILYVFLQAWIDQYFSRIKLYATNEELPSRIRFMLQDLIELRSNEVGLEQTVLF